MGKATSKRAKVTKRNKSLNILESKSFKAQLFIIQEYKYIRIGKNQGRANLITKGSLSNSKIVRNF